MVDIAYCLSYIALMATRYTQALPGTGQLLQVQIAGATHRLSILHAECDTVRALRSGHAPPLHAHDVYHIVFYTRGTADVRLGSQLLRVKPGAVLLSDPGQPHDFGPSRPGILNYHEVTFMLEGAAGALKAPFHEVLSAYTGVSLAQPAVPVWLEERSRRELELHFRNLLSHLCGAHRLHNFWAHRTLLDIFALLLRVSCGTPETVGDPLQNAREYLDRHFPARLSLAALARQVHLSKAYFCRAFKARFGLSPMAYRQSLRLGAAQNLLLTTDLQCKEIAARVGFADMYTFSKAFKRDLGASPMSFARR